MWKEQYRWTVQQVGVGGTLFAAAGYPVTGPPQVTGIGVAEVITSLDQAFSQAAAFNRRIQSLGIDAHFTVFGKPIGSDVPGALIPLAGGTFGGDTYGDATIEQTFVSGDTPERDLLRRIGKANRTVSQGGVFTDDFKEDSGGTEATP